MPRGGGKDAHDRIIEGSFSAYTVRDLVWKGYESWAHRNPGAVEPGSRVNESGVDGRRKRAVASATMPSAVHARRLREAWTEHDVCIAVPASLLLAAWRWSLTVPACDSCGPPRRPRPASAERRIAPATARGAPVRGGSTMWMAVGASDYIGQEMRRGLMRDARSVDCAVRRERPGRPVRDRCTHQSANGSDCAKHGVADVAIRGKSDVPREPFGKLSRPA